MATTVRKGDDRYPGSTPAKKKEYHGSTLLYGRSGSGKTTLASSWPKPILYLNIRDNGTDSINDQEDVDVKDINTSEELLELILWCTAKANKKKLVYKTIVLDTISQLQGIFVEEMGVSKKISGKATKGKKAGDFGTLTKQDWGKIAGDLKSVIMDIRNLPVESVFIAQERIFGLPDEEDDGLAMIEPEVSAKLMPSVKNDLCASVSIIGNTFIRLSVSKEKVDGKVKRTAEKIYCLRLGPNPVYTTKIRKPKGITAPDYIVDPTFKKIRKITKGKE